MKKTIIAALLMLALCGCENASAKDTVERLQYQTAGRNEYIITDTETGVQYLEVWTTNGVGLCVLVDGDGKPVTVKVE